ncbi:hypothetical protein H3S74_12250 [Gilliamella sp. W8126]|uniref:hypothetical protein n=1 Tax=Gilliamella sp. W8126 TaxID=2750946 RepID=UPI0018DC188A|nr:hypothetical protein [Gilliamella sp. W8126]MBI0007001.1 hypothetical protein [Gilliamella sp. W8126]
MKKIEKLDKNAFLKGANNGGIVKTTGRKITHFRLSLGQTQKEFISKLLEMTNLRIGQLIWQSILYTNTNEVSTSFLNEYINFIYDKKHGIEMSIQKVMTSHDNLKSLSKSYKSLGYNIGIKGVVLLYLLNYAKNYLKMDITKYKNFS